MREHNACHQTSKGDWVKRELACQGHDNPIIPVSVYNVAPIEYVLHQMFK